jgi:hypothetical protein
MKQLGNLAMVCAQRPEILLQIYNGQATVYAGTGPNRAVLTAAWGSDAEISSIIHELNFGKCAPKNSAGNTSEGYVPPKKCEGLISGSRAVTLINRLIDRMLNDEGGHVKPVIEDLLDMDFTADELIEVFNFSSSDVDECANGPDAPEVR